MTNNELMFHRFIRDLQEWIDAGFPAGGCFSRHKSVCFQLGGWFRVRRATIKEMVGTRKTLRKYLLREGEYAYPFNKGSSDFYEEEDMGTHYTNKKRLEWIARMATKAGEEE